MSDELDDVIDIEVLRHGTTVVADDNPRPARLVSRLYSAASSPQRASMLACLLRPLGTLGLAAVASGAFAGLLRRGADPGALVGIDEASRYSKDQIFELARFVEQVSPEALQQLANLIADNPVGMAAFSAAAAMLLLRMLRTRLSGSADTR